MSHRAERPIPQPSGSPLGLRGTVWVLIVTLAAQAWVLGLPFQLDDYWIVGDPLSLFSRVTEMRGPTGEPMSILRAPFWLELGLVRALTPAPLVAWPFHLAGLLLHAAAALALARVVARLVGRGVGGGERAARLAGVTAGTFFGISAGGIGALSWIAANADVLVVLFACLAVDAWQRARLGRPLARRCWGGAFAALALLSKVSALPLVLALPWVGLALPWVGLALPGDASGGSARRRVLRATGLDLVSGAVGVLVALALRRVGLGSWSVRYGLLDTPSGIEALALLPELPALLERALFPWNRDPLFADVSPALAGVPDFAGVPGVTWLVLAPCLLALVGLPRSWGRNRLAVLGALALAVVATLPAALIDPGVPSNAYSRTLYPTVLFLAAATGLAAGGLFASERLRRAAPLALALVALVLVDGNRHVRRTEELAGVSRDAVRGAVLEARAEQSARRDAPLLALVEGRPIRFGGIQDLGPMLPASLAWPFHDDPGLEVRMVGGPTTFPPLAYELDLARFDVVRLAYGQRALPEAPPAVRRDALVPRPTHAARPAAVGERSVAAVAEAPGEQRWSVEGTPAHAALAFALTPEESVQGVSGAGSGVDAGIGAAGLLELFPEGGDPWALRAESLGAGRLLVQAPADWDYLLGPQLAQLSWRGSALDTAPEVLDAAPQLEVLAPHWASELEPGQDLPAFLLRLGEPWARPSRARLELTVHTASGPLPLHTEVELQPGPAGSAFEVRAGELRAGHEPTPGAPAAPWPVVVRDYVAPLQPREYQRSASLEWRVVALHPGGAVVAAGPPRSLRFRLR